MTIPARKPGFRPDIEGLRGIAILLVILYHVGWSVFSGGYVGVDVFFVLSGYLISGLLLTELERTGRIDFLRFYARRTRRLFPVASLVLIATLFMSWLVYSPIERVRFGGSGLAAALYVSNVRFALGATNYLLAGGNKFDPLLHTWSLGVEEQFYLLWPFLVALVLRGRAESIARRRTLLLTMFVLIGASLALSIWLTNASQPWAFFGLPTRVWQFAAGGIAILIQRRFHVAWGWIALGAVILAGTLFSEVTPYPGAAALVPTIGTMGLLINGVAGSQTGVSRLLATKFLRMIGRVSYSWYLWHWPLILMGVALFPRGGIPLRAACAITALALAAVTYKVLENPVRRARVFTTRPQLAVLMGTGLIIVGALTSTFFRKSAQLAMNTPIQRALVVAQQDIPEIDTVGCMLDHTATIQPECSFGPSSAASTIVLFGDSHAGEWFPALQAAMRNRNERLVVRIRAECPAPEITIYSWILRRRYHECDEWRATVMKEMILLHPSLVVMGSAQGYVAPTSALARERNAVSADEWKRAVSTTLAKFAAAGIPVAIIRDTPTPGFDVPICLSRAAWSRLRSRADCTFVKAGQSAASIAEESAAKGFQSVSILDPTHRLCPSQRCDTEIAGMILYRDADHITASFSRSLAPYFETKLTSAAR